VNRPAALPLGMTCEADRCGEVAICAVCSPTRGVAYLCRPHAITAAREARMAGELVGVR
jgi:hypothetical protein